MSILFDRSYQHMMPAYEDTSCHQVGRKKRRGMIEKRRRDRINNSLNELRRLVPAAFEKQGSAKLEKAEILQMTVDHLTMLHAKGFDAFSFDPHKFAMDYHSIGFRECASEVARYLVANEGLDLQDPMRLRMMSHLQCYAAQRELALKSSAHASVWNPSAFTTPTSHPYPGTATMSSSSTGVSEVGAGTAGIGTPDSTTTSIPGSATGYSHLSSMSSLSDQTMMPPPPPLFGAAKAEIVSQGQTGVATPYTPSMHGGTMPMPGMSQMSAPGQYFGGYSHHPTTSAVVAGQSQPTGSVKHYRPWGAELAY